MVKTALELAEWVVKNSNKRNFRTASFDEHGIAPEAIEFGNVLTSSDLAEAAGVEHAQTGMVLREDAALERPDSVRFRESDHFTQQGATDSQLLGLAGHIHADFGEARIACARRNGSQGS